MIQQAELDGPEAHDPQAALDLIDPYVLRLQDLAHEDPIRPEIESAILANTADSRRRRVLHGWKTLRIRPRRSPVLARRRLLAQCLVGPFLVVLPLETAQRPLLSGHGGTWRQRCFTLQGEVHSLMP